MLLEQIILHERFAADVAAKRALGRGRVYPPLVVLQAPAAGVALAAHVAPEAVGILVHQTVLVQRLPLAVRALAAHDVAAAQPVRLGRVLLELGEAFAEEGAPAAVQQTVAPDHLLLFADFRGRNAGAILRGD